MQEIEKDKLYFYVLACENKQKVLIVKCPADNKEQKQFLGYEWSSAKGNEGIKYINQSVVAPEIEAVGGAVIAIVMEFESAILQPAEPEAVTLTKV